MPLQKLRTTNFTSNCSKIAHGRHSNLQFPQSDLSYNLWQQLQQMLRIQQVKFPHKALDGEVTVTCRYTLWVCLFRRDQPEMPPLLLCGEVPFPNIIAKLPIVVMGKGTL